MNIERLSILMKRVHLVRLALAVIVLNLILFVFVVLPQNNRIARLQSEYGLTRTRLASSQKNIANLKNRLQRLQQAENDLKSVYSRILIPNQSGVTDIRLELESLAQSLEIKKENFTYNYEPLPDFNLQQFRLGVPVEGNYRNIRRFINSIERSKHFLILERVDLSEQKSDILNLDFQLSTYLTDDKT
jgi:type IV pilus assembly protein PilO